MEPIRLRRGYTLIELLVVLAIIITITAVVFSSHSSFNKTIILQNTAYDIALTIRSAESFGLGTRAVGTISKAGYGVHFDKNNPNSFFLFADTDPQVPTLSTCHGVPPNGAGAPDAQPGDCIYTAANDQTISTYTLGNGITVSDFHVHSSSGWACAVPSQNCAGSVAKLDIVFARPNPNSFVSKDGVYDSTTDSICLTITSPQGGNYYVDIRPSGMIAVVNDSSCGS